MARDRRAAARLVAGSLGVEQRQLGLDGARLGPERDPGRAGDLGVLALEGTRELSLDLAHPKRQGVLLVRDLQAPLAAARGLLLEVNQLSPGFAEGARGPQPSGPDLLQAAVLGWLEALEHEVLARDLGGRDLQQAGGGLASQALELSRPLPVLTGLADKAQGAPIALDGEVCGLGRATFERVEARLDGGHAQVRLATWGDLLSEGSQGEGEQERQRREGAGGE